LSLRRTLEPVPYGHALPSAMHGAVRELVAAATQGVDKNRRRGAKQVTTGILSA
jgi:hypothetical protein